jgi:adenylate kinase
MRVIMLSPPGAGKGTQAKKLSAATGVRHISSGEVLRAEIERGSDLGRKLSRYTSCGDLVPDELIFDILTPAVVDAVAQTGGYLLDGFPRTMPQALRAAELGVELGIRGDAAVYLVAAEEVLMQRLLHRAEREGRADDTSEVIKHRLAVFATQTQPLVEYYRSRGILREINADRPEDEVQHDLRAQLGVETT